MAFGQSREGILSASVGPLVSVITPAFNHESFIGACIESVLSQTYPHWEQIIIDDGSTDRTRELVREYSDLRIRLVEQPHQGIEALASTYNRALSTAKGSLIAILEGDDTWPTDKLATMVAVFRDPGTVLAFGDAHDMDDKGVVANWRTRTSRSRALLPKSIFFNDPVRSATSYLLSSGGQSFIPPSTVVIRRNALESIGGFQHVTGIGPVDVPTFARLSLMGKFGYFPQVLGYRRRHLNSATVQYLEPMSNTARDFALAAATDSVFGLTAAERKSVEESWRATPFTAAFWLGRICLINGHTKEARRHFAAAMGARDFRMVLASVIGWGLSWARCDMEGLARFAGQSTLK